MCADLDRGVGFVTLVAPQLAGAERYRQQLVPLRDTGLLVAGRLPGRTHRGIELGDPDAQGIGLGLAHALVVELRQGREQQDLLGQLVVVGEDGITRGLFGGHDGRIEHVVRRGRSWAGLRGQCGGDRPGSVVRAHSLAHIAAVPLVEGHDGAVDRVGVAAAGPRQRRGEGEMPGAAIRVGALAGPDRPHGAGPAGSGGKPLQVGGVQLLPVECYRHGLPLDPRQLGRDLDHIGEPAADAGAARYRVRHPRRQDRRGHIVQGNRA